MRHFKTNEIMDTIDCITKMGFWLGITVKLKKVKQDVGSSIGSSSSSRTFVLFFCRHFSSTDFAPLSPKQEVFVQFAEMRVGYLTL
jgi:hypothetical protein